MKGNKKLYEAIAILFQLVGIILYWLKIDSHGYLLITGFLAMGIFYFILELKGTTRGYFRVVSVLLPALVTILSVKGLVYGTVNFISILVVMIMYSLVTKRFNLLLKKS